MTISAELLSEAELLVGRRLGLRFGEDRRTDLDRAFLEGLRFSRLASPEAYVAWLATLPDSSPEWGFIASRLTVGETYFFRDRGLFDALEQHVLPALVAARRAEGALRLRLWSAGCSTGEEPYSLAVLLDRLLPDRSSWTVTLLATDVNRSALQAAQRGVFREWSLRDTPAPLRDRYFRSRRGGGYELEPFIREMVTFAPLNLAEDAYPSPITNTSAMDVIVCRNVLMYFGQEAQRASVARLQRALVMGGWLILSPIEASPELMRPLVPVPFKDSMLHRKDRAVEESLFLPSGKGEVKAPVSQRPPLSEPLPTRSASPPPGAEEGASLAEARLLADQGRLEGARLLCEAALARDRLATEGYLLLAAICQELGDIPAALEGLRRAIYLAPDSAPAHFLLGTLLLRSGARQRGRRCLENAIRLLEPLPSERAVDGAGGLTAGRLRETARTYLGEE